MITNEKQYKITKAQAQKFLEAYKNFDASVLENKNIAREFIDTEAELLLIQYKDLEQQILEYEELKSGNIKITEANSLNELPSILLKARIAQGLTQEDLAKKLGMKQQQIQRYEADMYSSTSFSRLCDIAHSLGIKLKITLI